MSDSFLECDECRVKAGSPILCSDCYERMCEHSRTGHTRAPRVCSQEVQEAARAHDERMKSWKMPAGVTITIVEADRPE